MILIGVEPCANRHPSPLLCPAARCSLRDGVLCPAPSSWVLSLFRKVTVGWQNPPTVSTAPAHVFTFLPGVGLGVADGFQRVFMCRVLTGESCLGRGGQLVPDVYDRATDRLHDTTVDQPADLRHLPRRLSLSRVSDRVRHGVTAQARQCLSNHRGLRYASLDSRCLVFLRGAGVPAIA